MPGSAASLLMLAAAVAAAAAATALPPLTDAGKLHPAWHLETLPQQGKPVTQYSAEAIDGRDTVRVLAQASYGNLVHTLAAPAPLHHLKWQWRMDQPNPGIDLTAKAGDDAAIKVCLSFDVSDERVPFVERQLLKLARSRSNLALPAATLCWVWAAHEAKGALIPNAFTRRVRYIVLRNTHDAVGAWVEESRDVAADFRRAFGDEVPDVPSVTAVIVGGDADNTGATSVAHISGLRAD